MKNLHRIFVFCLVAGCFGLNSLSYAAKDKPAREREMKEKAVKFVKKNIIWSEFPVNKADSPERRALERNHLYIGRVLELDDALAKQLVEKTVDARKVNDAINNAFVKMVDDADFNRVEPETKYTYKTLCSLMFFAAKNDAERGLIVDSFGTFKALLSANEIELASELMQRRIITGRSEGDLKNLASLDKNLIGAMPAVKVCVENCTQ